MGTDRLAQIGRWDGGSGDDEKSTRHSFQIICKEDAFEAALKLAYAVSRERVRLDELAARSGPGARARYEQLYPPAISDAGLDEVELLETFTTVFGYTRGEAAAGRSTLRPFRAADGSIRLHAIKAETEGLLFRLEPLRVANWLAVRGHLGHTSHRCTPGGNS